jgi:hypothetical protein
MKLSEVAARYVAHKQSMGMWLRLSEAGSPLHQAESSSSLFCLWTGRSLPAAPHPASRRRSCLQLRTDQCFCPIGTLTPLLVRTLRRTPMAVNRVHQAASPSQSEGQR